MYVFKNIVVTTDMSPNADVAIPFAVALAKQSGATLHLFHAFENGFGEAVRSGVLIGASAWLESVHNQRQAELVDLAASLASTNGLTVTWCCVHGHPAVEAVKFAAKVNANLIVLSTHGRAGVPHLIMGSIAEKIVRASPVPVLTVRPGETVPAEREFKTILVPTDFSESAETAIPYALELAKQGGAKLILAHVVENTTYYGDASWSEGIGPDVEQWTEALKADGEKKLAEDAKRLTMQSDVPVTTIMNVGRPNAEICAIATQCKADLVVMATHGYSGFTHLAFGSVAEQVLRSCTVPVLSIRTRIPVK